MNGRTAKILRRAAKQKGMGLIERSPEYMNSDKEAPRTKGIKVTRRDGTVREVGGKPQAWLVKGFNNADTVRGVYRYFKKGGR